MRKCVIVLMLLGLLVLASGCPGPVRFTYVDSNPELWTIAVNSLFVRGYYDDKVIVVDSDNYGRVMFLYLGYRDDYDFVSLMVSQKTTDKEAYFYDGINYLLEEETMLEHHWEATLDLIPYYFSTNQIENLKTINDWNKPIDEGKLFKVEITNRKYDKYSDKQLEEAFNTVSPYFHKTFVDYLTTDKNGYSVYLMIGVRYDETLRKRVRDQAYLFMLDKDGKLVGPDAVEPIDDLWHYQEQLYKFKEKNGWAFYQE
jgi:hypothetical protein